MESDKHKTRVVFRVWKDTGGVLALFPDVEEDHGRIMSYMHMGQHSSADYAGCLSLTRPATMQESKALREELTQLGYNLHTIRRRVYSKR